MSRQRQILLFAAVAAIALVTGFLVDSATRPESADAQLLLASSLPDLEGRPQPLAQWRGKVIVINFWATWCAPCRDEVPALVRLQRKLGPAGVQIVGIAVDEGQKVRLFVTEFGINYPVLIAELEALGLSHRAGNVTGALPYTVVLDRSGRVLAQHLGGLTEANLAAIVQPAL